MSSNSSRRSTNNVNAASFESFFQGWLVRQQHYSEELLSAIESCHEYQDDDLKDLIARVLAHYQQYYEEKSKIAQSNIFLLFSPPWFTSFEKSFLWVAGFKAGLPFRLVNNSIKDLTQEQGQRIEGLIGETRVEEKMLNDELAKIQESAAAPPFLNLTRRWAPFVDVDVELDGEEAMGGLRSAMEGLVASADALRTSTVTKVVEVLNPTQNVRFLAAATQLQLKIRSLGLQRDDVGVGQETYDRIG